MGDLRLYKGKVERVPTYNMLDAEIDLTLGVYVRRKLAIEGVDETLVKGDWSRATHCLVMFCGGHVVYLRADAQRRDEVLPARIYVPRATAIPHAEIVSEPDLPMPMLDLKAWMRWAATTGFDVRAVRAALKG